MRVGSRAPSATAVVLVSLALAAASPARGQIPGESVYGTRTSMRQEFLTHAFDEVKSTLDLWQQRVRTRDLKAIKAALADDAIFAPLAGWIARGRAEVGDSLAAYLPRLSATGSFRSTSMPPARWPMSSRRLITRSRCRAGTSGEPWRPKW